MTYTEYMEQYDVTVHNIEKWYGDFGIKLMPVWSNDGSMVLDYTFTWAELDPCRLEDAYRFAEALSAAAYEAAKLTGMTIVD